MTLHTRVVRQKAGEAPVEVVYRGAPKAIHIGAIAGQHASPNCEYWVLLSFVMLWVGAEAPVVYRGAPKAIHIGAI